MPRWPGLTNYTRGGRRTRKRRPPVRLQGTSLYPKRPMTAEEALALVDRAAGDAFSDEAGFGLEELRFRGCTDPDTGQRVREELERITVSKPRSGLVYGTEVVAR